MELTKNQKIVGVSLAGVVAWLLYRDKVRLQSHRADTPSGPVQVVVPVPTSAGTGAIANVLGNVLPTAHADLVSKALNQTPLVIQAGRMAPTRISTTADVQHALNFLKLCPVPLRDSGVLDAPTIACLKAFQNVMKIPMTGMDDPTTKMTLESAITKAAVSSAAPAIIGSPAVISPPVINPMIGTARDLQRGLNVLGASPKLKEDGKIGPVTTAAVKAFQVVHGLTADGLAGPQTKAALATAMQGTGISAPVASAISTAAPIAAKALAPVAADAASAVADAASQLFNGDFGYIAPPASPYQHPSMPGFMGAGGGYAPHRDPHWDRHFDSPPVPPGFGVPGRPAPPVGNPMQSWERWQQVHPGTSYGDYQGWYAQNADRGATINGEGDFGMAGRGGMRGGGGSARRRGRAFALGLPPQDIDEDVDEDNEVVETSFTEAGDPMFERRYHEHAMRVHGEAFLRGDRRFEHPEFGPHAPPLAGEHREERRLGLFDRFRGWFGFGRQDRAIGGIATNVLPQSVDQNPYIPPPATPPITNWDPFNVNVAPAVERWHPDDLRRREELEGRHYAPNAPIVPGRPVSPIVDHPTPPGPPPPRV